jgi:thymidylate synthase (FAD)
MKVVLLSHSPLPEKVIAGAAKLCYSNSGIEDLFDGLDQKKSADFVEMLASFGHDSPIEHISFTFGIEGVSRALTHQLVRHRIASFSQQSQRYVKLDSFNFVVPPEIEACEDARQLFLKAMDDDLRSYNDITKALTDKHYNDMIKNEIDQSTALREAEKKAIEDARFVLPNACETKIIVTMNARSLKNFFKHRCCTRAQWEIKAVADEMLKQVKAVAPTLFSKSGPSCAFGSCSEGKMSCGLANQMKELYGKKNG